MRKMLMLADREEISRGLAESLEYTEIGLRLGRDSSVISRDVARHGGRERYRAAAAHEMAGAGRERPKLFAVERSPRLRAVVCQQLRAGWSPASIAGRLPTEYAADESCRVSHEAIYQWVYALPVSTLAQELIRLRTARNRGERSTANSLGRSRPAHAASCAAAARYLARPPCRATSREITDESRPNRRPISLYSRDSAKPREISSRSVNINVLRTVHPVPPTRQDQMLRPAEPKVSSRR